MFYNYSIINKKKAKTIKHIFPKCSSSTVAINKHREKNNTSEKYRPCLFATHGQNMSALDPAVQFTSLDFGLSRRKQSRHL